ncbi:MAG: mevalonate kinase [Euryarchaeota archaeon]|nr:mevalonate kinase [Euryarchaeota archaeon]
MAIASAPGRVCLLGEHAVVYGEPALTCAIGLRTRAEARPAPRTRVHNPMAPDSPYLREVLRWFHTRCPDQGVHLRVASALPAASGLASSASVTLAALGALNHEFLLGLSPRGLAAIGHQVERRVQGRASPMDTLTAALGGALLHPGGRRLPIPRVGLVVGETHVARSTGRMVDRVARLRGRHTPTASHLLSSIGDLSRRGETALRRGDLPTLGRLMDLDHQMLTALGVSHPRLDTLVEAARGAGALGAKLTGAGGGGCMVALAPEPQGVARAIRRAGGTPILTRPDSAGIRQETKMGGGREDES